MPFFCSDKTSMFFQWNVIKHEKHMHAEWIGLTEALRWLLFISYFSVVYFLILPFVCFVFFYSVLHFAFQRYTLFFFICVLYLLIIVWIIFRGFCLVFSRKSLHSPAMCVSVPGDNFEPASHFQINREPEEDSKGIGFA